MGSITFSGFLNEIYENLDNREDVPSARIERWINHTYNHMTHPAIHQFEDLKTTYDITLVSGTQTYSLAEATVGYRVLAIRSVSYYNAASASIDNNTRRHRLKPMPIEEFDHRIHASGEPRHYIPGEGQDISFSLTPNNTNTVRCRLYKEVAKLVNSTDTTVLPEYFDEVLLTGAQAFAEFKLGMRDRANETFQLYAQLLNEGVPKEAVESFNWGFETQLQGAPHMEMSI